MNPRLRSRGVLALTLALISALLIGGLSWMTLAVLRLEREQAEARFEADIRRALWRLDSKAHTALAVEMTRPLHDYRLELATQKRGVAVYQLVSNQPTPSNAWLGRQFVLLRSADWKNRSAHLLQGLRRGLGISGDASVATKSELSSVDAGILAQVYPLDPTNALQAQNMESNLAEQQLRQSPPQTLDRDTQARVQQSAVNRSQGGFSFPNNPIASDPFSNQSLPVVFGLSQPKWVPGGTENTLVVTRPIQMGDFSAIHVSLLDWEAIRSALRDEVADLLPTVDLQPVLDAADAPLDRAMTALPIAIDPGPTPTRGASLNPLRIGLILAWAAAMVALAAIGLGGWGLLNLSERRMNFVSAVTHELRTPLTTLRLYLDMLASGLVRDDQKKSEYIQTLSVEADRLNRLVSNVLDFSRLENQNPRLEKSAISTNELLARVQSDWLSRCQSAGKQLVIANELNGVELITDEKLVSQILGNLIDNACKYSQDAADPHIWLRARRGTGPNVYLEVEDRGNGVSTADCRSIFRPFRRGKNSTTTGGVGLGLALAQRWAHFLGGKLTVRPGESGVGACFQLELPATPSD
jgi:signal transduction histidine kinase